MTTISTEYQNYQRSQLMKELAAAAHGQEYRGQTSSATFPEIQTRIKMMHLAPNSRIVDAGCGNGAFSLALASHFPLFVDGIDLGEELTQEATKSALAANLSEKCRFLTGDFSKFSTYPNDTYNAVICIGSLYWGQPLKDILDIWHRITQQGGQLLLFINLAYSSLNSVEKDAIGATHFLSALEIQHALSQQGWALCEWSDATAHYIEWLKRWCLKMEELSLNLSLEMGKDKAFQLIQRFTTYLLLAQKQTVRRIIIRAEHV